MQEGYQQKVVEMVPYGGMQRPPMVEGENPMMQHEEIQNKQDALKIKNEKSKHKMSMTWKIVFGICGVVLVLGIVMVVIGVAKKLGNSLGKSGSDFFNDLVYLGIAAIVGPMLLAGAKWAANKYKESKAKEKEKDGKKGEGGGGEVADPNKKEVNDDPTKKTVVDDRPPLNDTFIPLTSGVYMVPALENIKS